MRSARGSTPLRDAKTRADGLREVVIPASNLPIADIERWYQGNYVEFLDGQLESLFYAILNERGAGRDGGGGGGARRGWRPRAARSG